MPITVAELNREHIEAYLVQLHDRTSTSTTATRHRGVHQMFNRDALRIAPRVSTTSMQLMHLKFSPQTRDE